MLAVARVLLARPKLLVCDEPSEGIQPSIIEELGRVLRAATEGPGDRDPARGAEHPPRGVDRDARLRRSRAARVVHRGTDRRDHLGGVAQPTRRLLADGAGHGIWLRAGLKGNRCLRQSQRRPSRADHARLHPPGGRSRWTHRVGCGALRARTPQTTTGLAAAGSMPTQLGSIRPTRGASLKAACLLPRDRLAPASGRFDEVCEHVGIGRLERWDRPRGRGAP